MTHPAPRRPPRPAEPRRWTGCASCGAASTSASTGSRAGTTSTRHRRRAARSTTSRPVVAARRAGRRHDADPARLPRLLRRLPEPRLAGEGGDDDRPHLRRPLRARPRGGLARAGGRAYGYDFPPLATRLDDARRGGADHPRPAHRGPHDPRRRALPVDDASCLPAPGAGPAADLDRRHRGEAHAAARRQARRRVERGVRVAGALRRARAGARRARASGWTGIRRRSGGP